MAITSYVDDNARLGKAYIERDYENLAREIESKESEYTYSIRDGAQIYAFDISKNESLSKIYNGDFKVVRIILNNVDTLHVKRQEEKIMELLSCLDAYMEENPGYYNLRIPTHFVDLIKAYNKIFEGEIFCGGTVEWIVANKHIDLKQQEGIEIFWANDNYIENNKEKLLQISYNSFKTYQGQYHISDVTAHKAGDIYEKWLENSFDDYKGNVLVVAYNGEPISFVLYGENEFAVEAVVGAVDSKYRKFGAYRLMISYGINYATECNKNFVTSTQFDNFIVQGVWASLGLKPFYSIYNVHVDRR